MVNPLIDAVRTLRLNSLRSSSLLVNKKTKGARAATRRAIPWRQGTETGSKHIILFLISTVNSQRRAHNEVGSGTT